MNVRIVHPELSAKKAYEKAFVLMSKLREDEDIAKEYIKIGANIESFIVTFMKSLLTLANLTLENTTFSDEEMNYRVKNIHSQETGYIQKQYINLEAFKESYEILDKDYYSYKFTIGKDKSFNRYSKISPKMLYSDKPILPKKSPDPKKVKAKKSTKTSKKTGKSSKKSLKRKCPEGKIFNPKTNRCVLKTGRIGREILKNLKN